MLLLKKDIKRILRGLNSFILFFFKMHSEQLILLEAQQSRVSQFIFPLDQKSFFYSQMRTILFTVILKKIFTVHDYYVIFER